MSEGARGYSWAPFEPGNVAALKHGASSPGRVEPLAQALQVALLAVAPWCTAPVFQPAVVAWANAEARVQLLRSYIDEVGVIDDKTGEPRAAFASLDKAEKRAETMRAELGLTPKSWAQLVRSMTSAPPGDAGGIEGLSAIGQRLLEGHAEETPAKPSSAPDGFGPDLASWLFGEDGHSSATEGDDDGD